MPPRSISPRIEPYAGSPSAAARGLIECPSCGTENFADTRLCNACGLPVDLVACPACGAVNRRDAAFCYKCQGSTAGRTSAERAAQPIANEPSVASRPESGVPITDIGPSEAVAPVPLASDPEAVALDQQRANAVEQMFAAESRRSRSRNRRLAVTAFVLVLLSGAAAIAEFGGYHPGWLNDLTAMLVPTEARDARSPAAEVHASGVETSTPAAVVPANTSAAPAVDTDSSAVLVSSAQTGSEAAPVNVSAATTPESSSAVLPSTDTGAPTNVESATPPPSSSAAPGKAAGKPRSKTAHAGGKAHSTPTTKQGRTSKSTSHQTTGHAARKSFSTPRASSSPR